MWDKPYIESTFWLDLHYVVALIAIGSVAALIGNMVWKIQLMRDEEALLNGGKEAAV